MQRRSIFWRLEHTCFFQEYLFGKNSSVEEIYYARFKAKVCNESECINNEAVFTVIEKLVGCEPMDLFHSIVWIKTTYLAKQCVLLFHNFWF